MKPILLIDFGSTCTKVTAVDLDAPRVLGTAEDFTTARTDVGEGLERALQKLRAVVGDLSYEKRYACSSAAGGLRMMACGLVPSLTAEAARLAALGAGAKVIRTFSYQLTDEDARDIEHASPDIFLLTGGTDGGNQEAILHNADVLASVNAPFPIVVAGNRSATAQCLARLRGSAHEAIVVPNVMPAFSKLNIEPAQSAIRAIFLDRIVAAKGLSRERALCSDILMPTPAACLEALSLLSLGVPDDDARPGLGELMAVDLGGATTDIYSMCPGEPRSASTVLRGLEEPYAKRTVEGDIGMRYSAPGVLEAVGERTLCQESGLESAELKRLLDIIRSDPSWLPLTEPERELDFALAACALRAGLERHAGTMTRVYTPMGAVYQQTGKDLSGVEHLILTGGALVHSGRGREIAARALAVRAPEALLPIKPVCLIDEHYVLSAMGLLAKAAPKTAYDLMKAQFGSSLDGEWDHSGRRENNHGA